MAALTACADSLAGYQQTLYEASKENDAPKLETASALADDYNENLGAFLDTMGAA